MGTVGTLGPVFDMWVLGPSGLVDMDHLGEENSAAQALVPESRHDPPPTHPPNIQEGPGTWDTLIQDMQNIRGLNSKARKSHGIIFLHGLRLPKENPAPSQS